MYQNWMFFRVTLDMLEMVFAKVGVLRCAVRAVLCALRWAQLHSAVGVAGDLRAGSGATANSSWRGDDVFGQPSSHTLPYRTPRVKPNRCCCSRAPPTPTPTPAPPQADPRVVKMYARHLVAPELHGLGEDLLARFAETEALLLQVRAGRQAGGRAAAVGGPSAATMTPPPPLLLPCKHCFVRVL